ncbi:hypothetical protein M758_5G033000 [Ceratodon purpureus]|nr:hypothetical protein M758_5G033000 [Ceratodon purpureus]
MTTSGEQAMRASGSEATGAMTVRAGRQLVYEWYTPSLARSVAFLQALGFKALRQEAAFAEMGWGPDARLFVEEVPEDPGMPAGYPGVYHGNIRVMVPDVDAVYRAAVVLPDGKILKPLADRYYGLRDFTLGGPFGLALRFATPLPGFSED